MRIKHRRVEECGRLQRLKWEWQCLAVFSALRKVKQENHEFTSLVYKVKAFLGGKIMNNKKNLSVIRTKC